jgi:hypothetical protein
MSSRTATPQHEACRLEAFSIRLLPTGWAEIRQDWFLGTFIGWPKAANG